MLWAIDLSSEMSLCIAYHIFSLYNGALLQPLQYFMVLENSVCFYLFALPCTLVLTLRQVCSIYSFSIRIC